MAGGALFFRGSVSLFSFFVWSVSAVKSPVTSNASADCYANVAIKLNTEQLAVLLLVSTQCVDLADVTVNLDLEDGTWNLAGAESEGSKNNVDRGRGQRGPPKEGHYQVR
jgi:hypothetical protein